MGEPLYCPHCGHIETDGVKVAARRSGLMFKTDAAAMLRINAYQLKRSLESGELDTRHFEGRECVTLVSLNRYINQHGIPSDEDMEYAHYFRTGVATPAVMSMLSRQMAESDARNAAMGIYKSEPRETQSSEPGMEILTKFGGGR